MSFVEKLINEVRACPALWDKRNSEYKNRLKNNEDWSNIAKNLNKTKNEVKIKWKNLRDVFMKETKKKHPDNGNYSGKWSYFSQMQFLEDIVNPRGCISNFENFNGIADFCEEKGKKYFEEFKNGVLIENIKVEATFETPSECSQSVERELETTFEDVFSKTNYYDSKPLYSDSSNKKIRTEQEPLNRNNEKQDDTDILFLMSLAPYFKYLNPLQNLRLRNKIHIMIADEISKATSSLT
ncbi:transcription factor Adf-1-like [Harmonia axyridis]|uniref:transcription factor Adf-1-like n=1 Tax=Harmonia axyridis TaxID=115357 RepID=UPI001E278079|nr:transcription factor Adf-1-like [Harmonia axyridis]